MKADQDVEASKASDEARQRREENRPRVQLTDSRQMKANQDDEASSASEETSSGSHPRVHLSCSRFEAINIRKSYIKFQKTSYFETLVHLLKGNIGSGLMAMGYAFSKGGLIFAPIVTLFLAITCIHAQHLLINAANEMKRRLKLEHVPNFENTVEYTLLTGPAGTKKFAHILRGYVLVALCVTQLGFCSVYFVFVTNSTLKILEYFDVDFANKYTIVLSSLLVPMTLQCWIRELKYLVPFSLVANLLMVFGIGATFAIMFSTMSMEVVTSLKYVAPWQSIPLFLGTTIYAFEGISLVLPLHRQMRQESHFDGVYGVLNVGMTIVSILIIGMGLISYLTYGEEVEGSVNLNLNHEDVLPLCVNISIATAVLLTFVLMMHVPVIIIWPMFVSRWGPFKHPVICETIVRTGLVILTYMLAILVPHLELIIALVGSMASTSLALVFPVIVDVVMDWQHGISSFRFVKNGCIFLLSVLVFVAGTLMSCWAIYNALRDDFTKG